MNHTTGDLEPPNFESASHIYLTRLLEPDLLSKVLVSLIYIAHLNPLKFPDNASKTTLGRTMTVSSWPMVPFSVTCARLKGWLERIMVLLLFISSVCIEKKN